MKPFGLFLRQVISLYFLSTIFLSLKVLWIIFIIGCGSNNNPSFIKHNINEPVRNTEKWNWYALDEEEFDKKMKLLIEKLAPVDVKKFLDSEHPFSKRINKWLDKIHKNLQIRYPNMMQSVPKPVVKVVESEDPNAFVAIFPVCLQIPILVKDVDINSAKLRPNALVVPEGEVSSSVLFSLICGDRKSINTKEDALSFVTWMNKAFTNGCQLTLKNDSTTDKFYLLTNDKCIINFYGDYDGASKLIYLATPNVVVMTTSLADMFDEHEFVAILAHELGHYYRSHPTISLDTKEYNYFYKLEEKNPNVKPKEDVSLRSFGQTLLDIKIPNRKYRVVPGQKFRSELFYPMAFTAKHIVTNQDCYDVPCSCNIKCEEFVDWFEKAQKDLFGNFPMSSLSEEGVKAYFEFENKISLCFQNVKIGKDKVQSGQEIFKEVVKKNLQKDPNIEHIFEDFEIQDNQDLLDVFDKAQKHLELGILKAIKPLEEAKNLKIGYYTLEQEADELGLEIISQIGIDPKRAVEAELKLTRFMDELYIKEMRQLYPFSISFTQCEALYKNSWKDEDGNYFFVPIADFADPHHSSCYRAFNLDREIAAHGFKTYVVASDQVEITPSWEELVADIHNNNAQQTVASIKHKFYRYNSDFRIWVRNYLKHNLSAEQ